MMCDECELFDDMKWDNFDEEKHKLIWHKSKCSKCGTEIKYPTFEEK